MERSLVFGDDLPAPRQTRRPFQCSEFKLRADACKRSGKPLRGLRLYDRLAKRMCDKPMDHKYGKRDE